MANTTKKRRIDEELVCADSLHHVLRTSCGCQDLDVHREQDDPPDFTITIDGAEFPTEVTSIVSREEYHAHFVELVAAIRKRAESEPSSSGFYVVTAARLPTIPKPTSREGRQLLDAAAAYIASTRLKERCPDEVLSSDSFGRLEIAKHYGHKDTVTHCWSAPGMWEGDIQNEIASLVQRSIDDKTRKLNKKGFSAGKVILLLYDAFAYGEHDDAILAFKQVSGFDYFHSIFWAASFSERPNDLYPDEPGRNGLFLYSANQKWVNASTV